MYIAAMFFWGLGWLLILGIVLAVMFVLGGIILAIGLISRYINKKKGIKKKYPKICIIIGGIFLGISIGIFGVTAISFWSDSGNEYNPETYDPHISSSYEDKQHNKEVMLEVVRCFDEDDIEGLKNMFSEEQKNDAELEQQISLAMDEYRGESISYDDIYSDYIEEGYNGDFYYIKEHRIEIYSLLTDVGDEYEIEIFYVLVNDKNTMRVGIDKIFFIDPNDRGEILFKIGK